MSNSDEMFEVWWKLEPHGQEHKQNIRIAWDIAFDPRTTNIDTIRRWLNGEIVILEWRTYIFPHGKAAIKKLI